MAWDTTNLAARERMHAVVSFHGKTHQIGDIVTGKGNLLGTAHAKTSEFNGYSFVPIPDSDRYYLLRYIGDRDAKHVKYTLHSIKEGTNPDFIIDY